MDVEEVWRAIDERRRDLADLLETFSPTEWETSSLCAGWRVRDVAAHLTLAQTAPARAAVDLVRARGSFDRMIRDSAVRQAARPVTDYAPMLRGMLGSRRKAPVISDVEPLIDVLVHREDMTRPLGRSRPQPPDASAAAVERAWSMGFPFRAQRRLRGFELVATDHPWHAGHGEVVEGTVGDLLLLVTGRDVVLPDLTGPGADTLRRRRPAAGRAPA